MEAFVGKARKVTIQAACLFGPCVAPFDGFLLRTDLCLSHLERQYFDIPPGAQSYYVLINMFVLGFGKNIHGCCGIVPEAFAVGIFA